MSYWVAPDDAFQVKTRSLSPMRLTVRPVTCGGAHDGAGAGAGAGVVAGGVDGLGAVGDEFDLSLPHAPASIAVTITHDSPARFIDITPIRSVSRAMAVPTRGPVQPDVVARTRAAGWLRVTQPPCSFVTVLSVSASARFIRFDQVGIPSPATHQLSTAEHEYRCGGLTAGGLTVIAGSTQLSRPLVAL